MLSLEILLSMVHIIPFLEQIDIFLLDETQFIVWRKELKPE